MNRGLSAKKDNERVDNNKTSVRGCLGERINSRVVRYVVTYRHCRNDIRLPEETQNRYRRYNGGHFTFPAVTPHFFRRFYSPKFCEALNRKKKGRKTE